MSTYNTPIPGIAGYAGAAQLANQAYANAMSRYQQQRSDTLLKYGYKQDASGGLSVDANNEYGGYQQMLRNEAGQNEGVERAQASSGWGSGSGYLGAQREKLSYAQGAEQGQLGQELSGNLTGISQGEQQATYDKNAALYQAEETATQNALAQQQFNPANPPTAEDPNDPYAPVKKAVAATNGKVKWGGKTMGKDQLKSWLKSHGGTYAAWAKQHPSAAKALGL